MEYLQRRASALPILDHLERVNYHGGRPLADDDAPETESLGKLAELLHDVVAAQRQHFDIELVSDGRLLPDGHAASACRRRVGNINWRSPALEQLVHDTHGRVPHGIREHHARKLLEDELDAPDASGVAVKEETLQ
eukprot:2888705-Pyramimonas_sp.AAC.1